MARIVICPIPKPMILSEAHFCPLGDIWPCLEVLSVVTAVCVCVGRRGVLVGRGQGCVKHPAQNSTPARPTAENDPAPMLKALWLRNPVLNQSRARRMEYTDLCAERIKFYLLGPEWV